MSKFCDPIIVQSAQKTFFILCKIFVDFPALRVYNLSSSDEREDLKMNNTLFKYLIKGYNDLAYTHNYIFGFEYKGVVYAVTTYNDILPYILKLDKASRGAGYALRFKPTNAQKVMLIAKGAEVVCSATYFNDMVANLKYNKGEVFEKIITENNGQEWTKDSVPFTIDGDLTVDGVAYQIKYQGATFTNEKILARLTA